MCETSGAAISSTGTTLNCFWLYESAIGDDGSCKSKTDNSLLCTNANIQNQCPMNDVTNLKDCFWILGNISSSSSQRTDICKKKV
jgi:hypothetical protein